MDWGEVNLVHAYYNGSCTSKDNEDPSWSISFKTRRTQKTSSALEDFISVVFVHDRNIVEYKPGISNQAADALSYMYEDEEMVSASFMALSQLVVRILPELKKENASFEELLIMENLAKISKKACILELNRRHLKITVLTTNTPYPSRKIRRICDCTSQKTTKETRSIRRIQDSENDNEKVNMPSFRSPEPKVSCFEDLDFIKDFENEFPAIVYNDALPSKSDFLTEPTLCPQHIDEFDLKDETSLSEYDKVKQNVLYFNDLFPFNIIHPDDLKSGKDNDDNKIDIIQSLGCNVEGYTKEIVHDFEQRLETIFGRQVNQVHILDFEGLTPDMRQDLAERLRMVYTRDDGHEVFVSHAWRRLFEIREPLVHEFLLDFFSTCRIGSEMRNAEGRKSGPMLSGGHFIRHLAHHFGLANDDGLSGLSVVTHELSLIDMVPIHAPLPPPPTAGRTMPQRLGRLEEEIQGLRQDVRSLRGLIKRPMTDQGRFSTWMVSCMMQHMKASRRTYQAFDRTFRGSYPEVFEMLSRRRT
ncbi:hypothetical protein Tco_1531906 [Tanacetum coccineum]